ncbi:MAG: hypothetical protein KBT36_14880 [Kurthia sp.]|nr:hypothetical protein [Candidatus Kurthia equi]
MSLIVQMVLSPFLGVTVTAEESLIKLTDATGQKIAQTEFSTDDLIYLTFLKTKLKQIL